MQRDYYNITQMMRKITPVLHFIYKYKIYLPFVIRKIYCSCKYFHVVIFTLFEKNCRLNYLINYHRLKDQLI